MARGKINRNTPEDVAKAVDALIQAHRDSDALPTDYDLAALLGISTRTLERYYEGYYDKRLQQDNEDDTQEEQDKAIKSTYAESLKRLVAYRSKICTEGIVKGGPKTTGWIFLSKQPHWGGFQDVQRVERSGNLGVQISLTGPDGKPLKNA